MSRSLAFVYSTRPPESSSVRCTETTSFSVETSFRLSRWSPRALLSGLRYHKMKTFLLAVVVAACLASFAHAQTLAQPSSGSGSMTWPTVAGLTVCTGTPCTAWGTSLTAPAGTIVGTSDTQALTNKDLTGAGNTFASASPITAGTAAGSPGFVDKTIGYITTNPMSVQSSATCTNVTNMSWNLAASKNYLLSCEMPVLFVASAQIQWCLNGPGANPSFYSLSAWGPTTAATAFIQEDIINNTAWGTKTATFRRTRCGLADFSH
jgi:hypothetical protein